MEKMWVDSIFLQAGRIWKRFDVLASILCPGEKISIFYSADDQEQPLKATGYFIFHQAIFICSVLFLFVCFLHCGTYKQLP